MQIKGMTNEISNTETSLQDCVLSLLKVFKTTRKRRPLQPQLYQRSRASLTSPVRSSYTYKSVTRKPLDAAPQLSKNRPQTSSTHSHPTSTILWSISARRLNLNQRNLNQFSEKENLNMSLGYLFLLAQTLLKLSSRSNNRRQPSLGN